VPDVPSADQFQAMLIVAEERDLLEPERLPARGSSETGRRP